APTPFPDAPLFRSARVHRAGVVETLVAVHHPRVVKTQLGVVDDRVDGVQVDDRQERRRGDDVRVARGLRGRLVAAERAGVTDRVGELGDLFPTDFVRSLGRIAPPDE